MDNNVMETSAAGLTGPSEPEVSPDVAADREGARSATSKHRAVWDWLLGCPLIGDLFFNAASAKPGATCLVPSEQIVERYIDGGEKRNYNCALTRFQAFSSDPNDMANIIAVTDLETLGAWVDAQLAAGNLPAFPEGCEVTDIRVLPNESGYMVAQDFTQAKYMIQFQIEYVKAGAPAGADDLFA